MLASLTATLKDTKDFLFSIEGLTWVAGKICILIAAWIAWNFSDEVKNFVEFDLPSFESAPSKSANEQKPTSLADFDILIKSDIFGDQVEAKPKQEEQTKKSARELKLRLVGTNVTQGEKSFAIIEDTAKNQQEVFDLNDKVFDGATLIKILASRVELKQDGGGIIVLQLEEGEAIKPGEGETTGSGSDETDFSVNRDELDQELSNLPRLLSQARAVPYFRNGQSVGMRLFAIRKDSMYDKLGLKNGDILMSINDNSLSDPSQALKLFETLKTEKSIYVTVERNGQQMDLRYSIN